MFNANRVSVNSQLGEYKLMWSRMKSPLWAVTSYFNPCKYQKRYGNFIKFREALSAPLVVVELEKYGEFELSKDDADIVIQLQGEDAIWQKERLINVGISHLPDHADYVAWVDGDLVFENTDWVKDTIDKLAGGTDLVQLFSGILHQGEHEQQKSADFSIFPSDYVQEVSVAKVLRDGGDIFDSIGVRKFHNLHSTIHVPASAAGHAWAARINRKTKTQFYDANILGAGDRIDVATCFTPQEDRDKIIERHVMSDAHYQHQRRWMRNQGTRTVGYTPGRVFHFWHGDFKNRRYAERSKILINHNFDPTRDIELSDTGAWQWTSPSSQLAKDVAHYFRGRREDG